MTERTARPAPTGPSRGDRAVAADRRDERLREQSGLRGTGRGMLERLRAGDLGSLPVVAGVVVIAVIFQSLNSVFLSSRNVVNLVIEMCPVGILALGIVAVLLVGQIDLSVGSVSGLSAATMAILFIHKGWPAWAAVVAAIGVGVVIGWTYGQLFNRFGVPSFVATLAGLLAFEGLQFYSLGSGDAITLGFNSAIVRFASQDFLPHWVSYLLVVLAAVAMFATRYGVARRRRGANLSAPSVRLLAVQAAALLVVLAFAAWYLNRDRGIGYMLVLFVGLVALLHYALVRTRWGRSVFAVGGNVEAARRAGINVKAIYTSCFVLCSTLAAAGGVLAAARLAAANKATGSGDVNLNAIAAAVIGGTSLFGGRGGAYSALLGIIVIQSISNGLTLLNLDSSIRFIVTGAVLLLAVALDSFARRSRISHGRA